MSETKPDPHVQRASEIFGVHQEQVSPTMRRYAKLRNFVDGYTPQKIGDVTRESREETIARYDSVTKNADYAELERRVLAYCAEEKEKNK